MPNTDSTEHRLRRVWRVRDPKGQEWGPYTQEELEHWVQERRIGLDWPAQRGSGEEMTVREALHGITEAPLSAAGGASSAIAGNTIDSEVPEPDTPTPVWKVRGLDGKEWGPYTQEQLEEYVKDGRIRLEWSAQRGSGPIVWVEQAIQDSPRGALWLEEKHLRARLAQINRDLKQIERALRPEHRVGGHESLLAEKAILVQEKWQIEEALAELDKQKTYLLRPDLPRTSTGEVGIAELLQLAPGQFEELVGEIYRAQGFKVDVTPGTGDQGIDVIASKADALNPETIAIQCKNHAAPVGRPDAQKLLGASSDPQYTKAVLVATGGFSQGCQEFAKQHGHLYLYDGEWVCERINELGIEVPR